MTPIPVKFQPKAPTDSLSPTNTFSLVHTQSSQDLQVKLLPSDFGVFINSSEVPGEPQQGYILLGACIKLMQEQGDKKLWVC